MTEVCAPPIGAEDGSLHWVEHIKDGKQAWRWHGSEHGFEWRFGLSGTSPGTAYRAGWRYIGPASPTDAADLAEARADLARREEMLRLSQEAVMRGHEHIKRLEQETQVNVKRIEELEAALMQCKYTALTDTSAQVGFSRIVRICIDAGVTMKLDELHAALNHATAPAKPEIPRYATDEMMEVGLYHSSHDTQWGDLFTAWHNMWDVAANSDATTPAGGDGG